LLRKINARAFIGIAFALMKYVRWCNVLFAEAAVTNKDRALR